MLTGRVHVSPLSNVQTNAIFWKFNLVSSRECPYIWALAACSVYYVSIMNFQRAEELTSIKLNFFFFQESSMYTNLSLARGEMSLVGKFGFQKMWFLYLEPKHSGSAYQIITEIRLEIQALTTNSPWVHTLKNFLTATRVSPEYLRNDLLSLKVNLILNINNCRHSL